jgi:hypothetical protein
MVHNKHNIKEVFLSCKACTSDRLPYFPSIWKPRGCASNTDPEVVFQKRYDRCNMFVLSAMLRSNRVAVSLIY